jgi:uncharacterized lipoprotein YmbA
MNYQRRPTNVEAFQATFPVEIKHANGLYGYLTVAAGNWVVRNEDGEVQVMSNEEFNTTFERAPTKSYVNVRAPMVNVKTITPEDVDMTREF